MAALAGHASGDLLARMLGDVDELQNLYMRVIGPPLVALLTGAAMLIFTGLFAPILAPLLLALSPFSIWYAQETRGYSMALALAIAAVLAGRASLSPPREPGATRRRAWPGALAYALLAAAALYTHLYSAFVLIALNFALAIRHLGSSKRSPAPGRLPGRATVRER